MRWARRCTRRWHAGLQQVLGQAMQGRWPAIATAAGEEQQLWVGEGPVEMANGRQRAASLHGKRMSCGLGGAGNSVKLSPVAVGSH